MRGPVGGCPGELQRELADPLNRPALILPGDRLSFKRGAESFELTIPTLTAEHGKQWCVDRTRGRLSRVEYVAEASA